MLTMNRIFLSIHVFFIECGIDEKSRKSLQGSLKPGMSDIKEIIGVINGGVGIVATTVLIQVVFIFTHIWKIFGSQEEHML